MTLNYIRSTNWNWEGRQITVLTQKVWWFHRRWRPTFKCTGSRKRLWKIAQIDCDVHKLWLNGPQSPPWVGEEICGDIAPWCWSTEGVWPHLNVIRKDIIVYWWNQDVTIPVNAYCGTKFLLNGSPDIRRCTSEVGYQLHVALSILPSHCGHDYK